MDPRTSCCGSPAQCPSTCTTRGTSSMNGDVTCNCGGCQYRQPPRPPPPPPPGPTAKCGDGSAPLAFSGCCADSCECPPGCGTSLKTNGMCHCGNGPGCAGTSGMEGCTHTESSNGSVKIENTSSDDDRTRFLIVYFSAIVGMCAVGKLASCCVKVDEEATDKFNPTCCTGNWWASKLGVFDMQTGQRLNFCSFCWRQHDLSQLCAELTSPRGSFKLANFIGDLAFAVSTALMLQSVSIGDSSRSTTDICQRVMMSGGTTTSGGGGGGSSSTITHHSSTVISQSSTQTSSSSLGDGSSGFTFENTGGPDVVMLCAGVRFGQGVIRGLTYDFFVKARSFTLYLVLGFVVHVLGFVMALEWGVRNPDNKAVIDDAALNIQRYCDAEEKIYADEAPPMEFEIYFQVVLYTLILGWVGTDNIKLAVKYAAGIWLSSGNGGGGDLEQSLRGGAE